MMSVSADQDDDTPDGSPLVDPVPVALERICFIGVKVELRHTLGEGEVTETLL